MGKHSKVSSSTKWRLGENFTYPVVTRLLTHLGVNKIRTTGVLNKNRLHKCTIIGDKQLQKRNVATLNSAQQAKKQCNFDSG